MLRSGVSVRVAGGAAINWANRRLHARPYRLLRPDAVTLSRPLTLHLPTQLNLPETFAFLALIPRLRTFLNRARLFVS
jgi:hypothetical protein